MSVVVGLDIGTTRCKAVALTAQGDVVADADAECPLYTPRPSWAEQDAAQVWRAVTAALSELVTRLDAAEITGLGMSGAMHSLLPVDADGAPLARAMTWADGRAASYTTDARRQGDTKALYRRTGCPLQSTYHIPRLRWWQAQGVEVARFVGIKDWILFRLTGAWQTDWGWASTTGLLDIHQRQWDTAALQLAGITAAKLPQLIASHAVAGRLTAAAAAATGLPAGLPVVAGSSDGALAHVGAGATAVGETVVSVGTSGAVRKVVAQPWLDERERTWCYVLTPALWLAGGAINNGGLALEWIRQRFYGEVEESDAYETIMAEVAQIPAGANGVLMLPYLTGERTPHWEPQAVATIHGLRLDHTRGHVARAALEAVAFCLADVWQAVVAEASNEKQRETVVTLTGGIIQAPVWCQIVADVLGIPLTVREAADASALGAARLAQQGLMAEEELTEPPQVKNGAVVEPNMRRHRVYQEQHGRFQALYYRLAQENT